MPYDATTLTIVVVLISLLSQSDGSFQNNAIQEEGVQALADLLLVNRKLVSLKWVGSFWNRVGLMGDLKQVSAVIKPM